MTSSRPGSTARSIPLRLAISVAIVALPAIATASADAAAIEMNRGDLPSLTPRGTNTLVPGDFDGDGATDLLSAEYVGDFDIRAFSATGDGSGGFGAPASDSLQFIPRTAGDVTGDGLADLIGSEGDSIAVSVNEGGGQFSPDGFTASPDVDLTDLDGDGDLDSVAQAAPSRQDGGRRVFLNDGSGGFTASDLISPPSGVLAKPAFGDVNGDGPVDIVACRIPAEVSGDPEARGIAVFLGDGAGEFEPAPSSSAQIAQRCGTLAVGDLDGDGTDDVVTDRFRPFAGSPSGELAARDSIPSRERTAESVQLADFDRDGELDAAFGAGGIEIWRGDGQLGFGSGPGFRLTDDVRAVRAVSLDGAGAADDLIAVTEPGGVPITLANLSGSPATPQTDQPSPRLPDAQSLAPTEIFDTDDPRAAIECSLDFGDFVPCDQVPSAIEDGTHVLSGRARDGGSVDPTPAQVALRIDTTAPSIDITLNTDPDSGFPTAVVSADVGPNEPRVTGVFRVKGSERAPIPFELYSIGSNYNLFSAASTRDLLAGGRRRNRGPHDLIVRATDPAGNVTRIEKTFRVR